MALLVMIVIYLALAEAAKHWFFRHGPDVSPHRTRTPDHRLRRRAARLTVRA